MEQKGSRRFGQYLKQLREERRLTLDQVEERSLTFETRISKAWLSRCENGLKQPSIDRLSVLSKIYHTSIGQLVDRRELEAELDAIAPIDVSSLSSEEFRERGMEFAERGELKAAIACFRGAEERAFFETGDFRSEAGAKAQLSVAIALARMARYRLAKDEAEAALGRMAHESLDALRALLLIAMCHLRQGNAQVSRIFLEGLRGKLDALPTKDRADFHLFNGNVQEQMKDYRGAIKSYRRASALYKTVRNLLGQAKALRNAGISYGRLGERERGIQHVTRALNTSNRVDDKQEIARDLETLGELHYLLGAKKQARSFLNQSIELSRRGDYFDTLFAAYFYLWRIDKELGRRETASLERAMRSLLPKLEGFLEEAEEFRALSTEKANA